MYLAEEQDPPILVPERILTFVFPPQISPIGQKGSPLVQTRAIFSHCPCNWLLE